MSTTTESAKILLVSKNPAVIEAAERILAQEESLNLIDEKVTIENWYQIIAETKPDVILFDFTFHAQPFDLVDKIISSSTKSAVIAILWESKNIDLDRVVLSGARAFVKFPFQEGRLQATIKRVLQLIDRHRLQTPQVVEPEEEDVDCNMFTVFSPKGGAGTTTVATNLAISLHKTLGEDVLLIDGKLMFGHIALYLNLLTGNSINDLITYAEVLDDQIIEQVVVQHASGIHVLLSPHSIGEAQGIRPEDLFEVIQSLQRMYPNIVVDGGHNLDENSVTFMDASDKILLVVNPELSSMRDANQFMEISSTLSYPQEKIALILNLIKRKKDVKTEEVERVLNMEIFGKIPADEKLAVESINEGVPIFMKKPHHSISKAYKRIVKDLVAQMEAVMDEISESEADA
jgi:pilus assembly protein CpaE